MSRDREAQRITLPSPEVGQTMAPWSRRTDIQSWNRYAAVNDEFLYFHMEDEAGIAAGNPRGAFGMGNLRFAYLHNALLATFGDSAIIEEVACQFRAVNQKGDVLTVVGTVTAVTRTGEAVAVSLSLDVIDAGGRSTCPATARVLIPAGSGHLDRDALA
jgi:acyl dehydratase